MAWFTGTSTGDRYTVGQVYANGNGAFRAEADGSFTNINSGKSLVGSSQDPRVTFGGTSSSLAGPGGGGYFDTNAPARTGGPGVVGASVSGTAQAVAQSGVGVAVNGDVRVTRGTSLAMIGSAEGVLGATSRGPKKTTELYVGGDKLHLDTSTSDGADFEDRWGEWGGAIAGIGVMVNDIGHITFDAGFKHGMEMGARAWEIEAERENYRANGVMAPMGAPASLNW